MSHADEELIEELLAGNHRALARVITKIEDRSAGYRDLVSALYSHTGHADVIGVTGSPGAGKSTLVDKLAKVYRDQGLTVGVIAVDPSSPFTGGAVLGDRVRMASTVGDMDVFVRSMSTRGSLGGLSTATTDAVKALDAFGKDKILIETVGAGQNEIDVVKTADTVAVLVPPESGDAIQMLKAGILEIGDVFVVNKADLDGVDRTVQALREMIQESDGRIGSHLLGGVGENATGTADGASAPDWEPAIVETIAKDGTGIDELLAAFADHRQFLDETGLYDRKERTRYAEEIRTLLREEAARLMKHELDRQGGIEEFVTAVQRGDADPYRIVDGLLEPVVECLEDSQDQERDRPREPGQESV
ncbi:MAG: methylmalonyl Co-A mutase-associated GTPase MeaB [Halobacteriales archaeon]|nr:methylmalonyl Co-A mutase-associated GTPase MeaB [Halobacteriales archaeon]